MRIVKENRSDQELVAVCNRGERREASAAFGSLYERHRDYVLRVAMRFTQDRDIAADALQEVFTYLLKQFPPPGSGLDLSARLTTYLYPIAKNSTLTLLRKARRFESTGIEPDDLPGTAGVAAGDDDLDRLLANLSVERREILTLRFVDGLALDEIAAALEVPLGTVKSRLHNAIKTLREQPEAKEFFDA
jgi:RNA polymerase sigma-70 factor (ECF subfamily)